jgi:hypothetical protein
MSFGDGIANHCAEVWEKKGKFAAIRSFMYCVVIWPIFFVYCISTIVSWANDDNNSTLLHVIYQQIQQVARLLHRLW